MAHTQPPWHCLVWRIGPVPRSSGWISYEKIGFWCAYRSITGFVVLSERWKEGRWVKKTPSCFHQSAFHGVAGDAMISRRYYTLDSAQEVAVFFLFLDNIIYICEDLSLNTIWSPLEIPVIFNQLLFVWISSDCRWGQEVAVVLLVQY